MGTYLKIINNKQTSKSISQFQFSSKDVLNYNFGLNQKSKPCKKVSSVIKDYPTLHKNDLKLSSDGLSSEQQQSAWNKVNNYLHKYKRTMIGHQGNMQDRGYNKVLASFLDMHINNIGDPFITSNNLVHTKAMECAVLEYFAELWHLHQEGEDEEYWGYVVPMGATEANIYALYNARGYLTGRPLLHPEKCEERPGTNQENSNSNAFTPVVFYSDDAHYSMDKAVDILAMKTFHEVGSGNFPCPLNYPDDYPSNYSDTILDKNGWPQNVPAGNDGAMYLPSLVKLVTAFISKGYPPIIVFTEGCAFKGSYDNPKAAIDKLVPILKAHNIYERRVYYSKEDPTKYDTRHGFWFHIDGALGAAYLPFLEIAMDKGLVNDNIFTNGFPVFDFRLPEVMSISMSVHKWFGCPFPAGIYMTRKQNQVTPPSNPLYIGSGDTTLSGSRNGHSVITLWDTLSKNSHHQLAKIVARQEKVVKYSLEKLRKLEHDLGEDLWVSRSPGSLFICFKEPRTDILFKYSLASNTLLVKSQNNVAQGRRYSHICIMGHVDEKLIDEFMEDLKCQEKFPLQNNES